MKNALSIAIAAFAFWYFVKEGEKLAAQESENLSIIENLKNGFNSTLNKLFSKSSDQASVKTTVQDPGYTNEKVPNEYMINGFTPQLTAFSKVQLPKRRGSFVNPTFYQRSN